MLIGLSLSVNSPRTRRGLASPMAPAGSAVTGSDGGEVDITISAIPGVGQWGDVTYGGDAAGTAGKLVWWTALDGFNDLEDPAATGSFTISVHPGSWGTLIDLRIHAVSAQGVTGMPLNLTVTPAGTAQEFVLLTSGDDVLTDVAEAALYIARQTPTEGTGLVGDGVTDDSAAFSTWFAANSGTTLILDPAKTYLVSSRVTVSVEMSLNLNGATVNAPKGFIRNWVRTTKSGDEAFYGAPGFGAQAFALANGATTLSADASWGISIGDVLNLWALDALPAAGTYLEGFWTVVTNVVGNTVTFSPAAPRALSVAHLRWYEPFDSSIVGPGTIDITGGGTNAGDENNRCGLMIFGNNTTITGLTIVGDSDCERGIMAEGNVTHVGSCTVSGITNDLGISGGRLGYGIDVGGLDGSVMGCTVSNCKHGITSATARTYRANRVTFRNNTVTTPSGQEDTAVLAQPKYQAAIDVHASVREAIIENNTINCVNSAIGVRAPATINDNTIVCSGTTTSFAQNLLINIYEHTADVTGSGNSFSVTAPGDTTYAYGLQGFASVTPTSAHGDIVFDDTTLAGDVSLFTCPNDGNATLLNVLLGALTFTNVSGSAVNGIRLIDSATYPFGHIGAITRTGSATYSGTASNVPISALTTDWISNVDGAAPGQMRYTSTFGADSGKFTFAALLRNMNSITLATHNLWYATGRTQILLNGSGKLQVVCVDTSPVSIINWISTSSVLTAGTHLVHVMIDLATSPYLTVTIDGVAVPGSASVGPGAGNGIIDHTRTAYGFLGNHAGTPTSEVPQCEVGYLYSNFTAAIPNTAFYLGSSIVDPRDLGTPEICLIGAIANWTGGVNAGSANGGPTPLTVVGNFTDVA